MVGTHGLGRSNLPNASSLLVTSVGPGGILGATKELHALPQAQARFIEPMELTDVQALPDGQEWAYEAKLDGYRCLVGKTAASVTLWSRRGTLFTPRFPEIAHACDKLPPETVVDGEVVAIDDNGRASFNRLQHHRSNRHLQFYAFDLPDLPRPGLSAESAPGLARRGFGKVD